MVRAIPVAPDEASLPPPAKKPKIDDATVDDPTVEAVTIDAAASTQIHGRRSKKSPTVDGALSSTPAPHQSNVTAPSLYPLPPPPPPPPPADNPYYQKFVEAYWQKYGSDPCYSTNPLPPPSTTPLFHTLLPPKPTLKRPPTAPPTTPLTLPQEFPINPDRPTYFLGHPTRDPSSLSPKSCYLRTRLIEVFLTLPSELKSHPTPRLGLRCVYCALHPPKFRAERSVTYPSSVRRLYNAAADMQHCHLKKCSRIPAQVRERALGLNATCRGRATGVSPKVYWEECAREMGMEDLVEGGRSVGIRLREGHGMVGRSWGVVVEWFGGEKKKGGEREGGEQEEETVSGGERNEEVHSGEGKEKAKSEEDRDEEDKNKIGGDREKEKGGHDEKMDVEINKVHDSEMVIDEYKERAEETMDNADDDVEELLAHL